jgi:hypothetical protein
MVVATSAFAVLDLPPGSVLSFDGTSVALKRDDFVGFSPIPTDGRFHLVTFRAAAISVHPGNAGVSKNPSATTVGFAFTFKEKSAIVRRFDPKTEEVSPVPVDETTTQNLLSEIERKQLGPERIVSYDQFVTQGQVETWKNLTTYITDKVLLKRGIQPGVKLIPGSFEDDDDFKAISQVKDEPKRIIDGKALEFPDIPVLSYSDRAQHSKHTGTKRFIALLSASERTALFMDSDPANRVLELILQRHYDNQWEDLLGDVQLSYVVFLNLHCWSSLTHWRDLVCKLILSQIRGVLIHQTTSLTITPPLFIPAMLSVVDLEGMAAKSQLYSGILQVLSSQLKTMDADLFDGQLSVDNVLMQSLQRYLSTLSRVVDKDIVSALERFRKLLVDRFPDHFGEDITQSIEETTMDTGAFMDSEDDDEDGPIVVPADEIEASFARSKPVAQSYSKTPDYPGEIRLRYPLLFAAMTPNEDIVMTCARALDDSLDVSLVREAAAYLEEVEARQTPF